MWLVYEWGSTMKTGRALLLHIALVLMSALCVLAQDSLGAAHKAEALRAQLRDVQDQEAALNLRVQQLDYDLKPENIRNYFAGVGSLRPEEMREQRRLQLQNEKDRALARLEDFAASRQRLEAAILTADAEVYQESIQSTAARQGGQMLGVRYLDKRVLALALALVAVVSAAALVALIRRR